MPYLNVSDDEKRLLISALKREAVPEDAAPRVASLLERLEEPDNPDDARVVAMAQDRYDREGEIEVDDGALVSRGDDPGAYVMAWVWVDFPDDEDDDED